MPRLETNDDDRLTLRNRSIFGKEGPTERGPDAEHLKIVSGDQLRPGYGVLLKPLPFHEPERLVSLQQIAPHGAGTNHGRGTYLTYRENQQVFEGLGAWDPTELSITGGGDPERVQGLLVSASTLALLRVQPILGRAFGAEDDTPGAPLRAMLTHGYWQRRFGGA